MGSSPMPSSLTTAAKWNGLEMWELVLMLMEDSTETTILADQTVPIELLA